MTDFQRKNAAGLMAACALALAACSKQPDTPTAPAAQTAQPGAFTAADCDRLSDPKALDDSAAGKATAVSQGMAAREACKKTATAQQDKDKPNADLARIREIKEREEAQRNAAKVSEEEFKRGFKEGAKQPLRDFKY